MKDQKFPPRRHALVFATALLLSGCGLKSALTLPPSAPAPTTTPQPDTPKPKTPEAPSP
ncbi:MAG: LPS translocon maturation chaperone LptM [Burkholderiales bacterium]